MKHVIFIAHLTHQRAPQALTEEEYNAFKLTSHKHWAPWMDSLKVGQIVSIQKEKEGIEIDCIINSIKEGLHSNSVRIDLTEFSGEPGVMKLPETNLKTIAKEFAKMWCPKYYK